ncbi:hypothetical protein LPJ66_008713 [Kickxella alabastrina]|uniref:Uncharacterized protein n=1 Tax=Kickxella alabastrina TaxID=61397 RepID=A0ACC1I6T3_9FUNG|nr:hypothetical protein LPJ66_008713 [Kickxella alabastrina]
MVALLSTSSGGSGRLSIGGSSPKLDTSLCDPLSSSSSWPRVSSSESLRQGNGRSGWRVSQSTHLAENGKTRLSPDWEKYCDTSMSMALSACSWSS